ncbi:MAG: hypothetical protein J6X17_00635 [Lachnospiraceae bacterium]|nr:hypothetical protein [Lachnospiraceae bacterium]
MKTVNRHLARIFAIELSAIMLVSNTGAIEAKAAGKGIETVKGDDTFIIVEPGKTTHFSIPVSISTTFDITRFLVVSSSELITVKNIKALISDGAEYELVSSGTTFRTGAKYTLDFDVVADENLKIGTNSFTIQGYGFYYDDTFDFNRETIDLITFTTYTSTELMGPDVVVSKVDYSGDPTPGTNLNLTLTLKNVGDIQSINNYTTITLDSGMIPNYSVSRIKIADLAVNGTARIDVPVKILEDAEPGLHTITLNISGKTKSGEEKSYTQTIYLTIKKTGSDDTKNVPSLSVATDDNYTEITPETEDSIKLTLKNDGSATASDIKVEVVSGFEAAGGITKNYTTDSIAVESIKSGKSKKVDIPFVVSKNVASGLHEITLKVTYSSASGKEFSENITVYLFVSPEKGKNTDDVKNNIYIKNVTQTPASPKAGEKVTVSFDIVNDGKTAVDNFKIAGSGLSSSGFEPLTNDPYAAVGSIAAGATKHVNVSFKCGKRISEGMNTLGLTFTYTDANDEQQTVNESVYVLNVIADADAVDVGRPKLIVSDYGTDQDILKAGNTFMFNFTLKNTHAVKAAKNIKITLSQNEGIFEPAQGTNIFYIDEIKAGTTSSLEIELKTRVDAITGDYPIVLLVEYEYDDMSDVDKEKGGVSEENTIKLRAIENYRPVIQNVAIDGWAGVNVNEAVDLNFEFYNMGKSVLGNVFVTVEGDFMLANNSTMSYVGAVQGYSSEYVTLSVVPTMGGEATGTLTVHFEDSNGDEVTISQDFTQYVNDNGGFDPGFDPGYDPGFDPGFDPGIDPGLDPDGEGGAKKILGMPKWLFFTVCGVVAAGAVAGGIVIAKKKKNKVKDIDDEDY